MTEHQSICAIVHTADPLRILLLRRPAHRAAGWQPVTGRLEPHDATPEAACVREIREETGFEPPTELVDLLHETTFIGYDGHTYHQRTFAARYEREMTPVLSAEHEQARWVDVSEALEMLTWADNKAALTLLLEKSEKKMKG